MSSSSPTFPRKRCPFPPSPWMHLFQTKRPKIKDPIVGHHGLKGVADVQTVLIHEKEIELLSIIGEGQFGKVYKGKCRGGPVAIKRINLAKSDKDELMTEIQILAAERHNNIVLLLGVSECLDGELMIITELCARGDLKKILSTPSIFLSLQRKIGFAIDIATGMAWMAEGSDIVILHRDLKPANVLVTQDWQCKIADFGLANVKRKKKTYRDAEFLPGSLPYMAPEVFESKELTSALDVYSFGIVLWEIYTRETRWYHPIEENFEEEVVHHHKRPPIHKIQHAGYAALTSQCWAHNPEDRPEFSVLPDALQKLRTSIFLQHYPSCEKLWQEKWISEAQVPFVEFSEAIFEHCKQPKDKLRFDLFQKIACPLISADPPSDLDGDMVDISHFHDMLLWCCPRTSSTNLIEYLVKLCCRPWFFGLISSTEAKQRLTGTPEGTFLVRFNSGRKIPIEEAPYVLTRVDPWSKDIRHTYIQLDDSSFLARLYTDPEHKQNMVEVRARSLFELLPKLARVKVTLNFAQISIIDAICPGHPFAAFIESAGGKSPLKNSNGYDLVRPPFDSTDSLDCPPSRPRGEKEFGDA